MMLNVFGELTAGGGESSHAGRKDSSGGADVQIRLFRGGLLCHGDLDKV